MKAFFLHAELGLNPTKIDKYFLLCNGSSVHKFFWTNQCCWSWNFPCNWDPQVTHFSFSTRKKTKQNKKQLAIQKLIKTYNLSHGNKQIASTFHNLCSFELKWIILKDLTMERGHSRNITKPQTFSMFTCLQTIRNISNSNKTNKYSWSCSNSPLKNSA